MIDITKVNYNLILVTETGKQYNLTDYILSLGWEQNEKELSTRISFVLKNEKTDLGYISSLTKLGCLVCIFAGEKNNLEEVARGYIVDWKPTISSSTEEISCTCYDELYNLQESQDNIYFSKGIGTKSAITQICKDWSIPLDYQGPDITHTKLIYKSETLSNILLDILDDAKKKGGVECCIRAEKGKINVLPIGNNKIIYHFGGENIKSANHSMSTAEMVTRVKIIGQEDNEGKTSVEAVINGKTEFGIRQKIYNRPKEDSLDAAKTAAQEILNEKGIVQEEISIQAPDVPSIKKGDIIHITINTLNGYYYIVGIRHDVDTATMSMDLKKTEQQKVGENTAEEQKNYKVGDIVEFKGGTHYVSSYAGSKGYSAKAGKAKITNINIGKAYPYHLIHQDNTSNVYGWVAEGSF